MRKIRGIMVMRLVALAGLLLGWSPGPATAADVIPLKVIANPSVPGKSIKKQALGEIFLRKVDRWGDGTPITPVDLQSSSPARRAFNHAVLGLSAIGVQQYWVAQMSRGKFPPPVKKSEDEAIAFVASNRGAIGYLSAATATPDAVKVLQVD